MKRLTEEEKGIIKSMRRDNKGYAEIAKVVDWTRNSVKSYCNRNGLGGYRANNYNDNNVVSFFNRFKDKHGASFGYIYGFENTNSFIAIQCKSCGNTLKRKAISAINNNIRCEHCIRLKNEQLDKQRVVCKALRLLKAERDKKQRNIDLVKECDECCNAFKASTLHQILCIGCRRKRENRHKELRKRMVGMNGDVDYSISLEKLIKTDNNICYLCSGECNSSDHITTNEGHYIVGANYPSIEHVKPISKGGTHTWGNIKLAHHYCNTIKNDKFQEVLTAPIHQ